MYLKYYYRTALTNDVSIALFITNWYFNRGWINGFSTVGKSNGAEKSEWKRFLIRKGGKNADLIGKESLWIYTVH
jgi:hypothetical protein